MNTHRFTTNKIVHSYCLVLKEYRSNSDSVNHATVKMLYRIAVHLNMAPLLYQISVFRTLQSILHEPNSTRVKVSIIASIFNTFFLLCNYHVTIM